MFVAEIDLRIVRTFELILIDNLARAGAKAAILEDVAADPKMQDKGIGKALMNHAKRVARDNGAYSLALSSNSERHEAHAFYDALGFKRHGISFVVDP